MKKENSQFLSITFGQPHFRRPFLCKRKFRSVSSSIPLCWALPPRLHLTYCSFFFSIVSWSVDFVTFGEEFHYFIYVVRKGEQERIAAEEDVKDVSNLKVEYFDNRGFEEVTDDNFLGKVQDNLFSAALEL